MSPASIQTLGFISYCSTVQGRVAGASTIVYEFDSVVEANTFMKAYGFHSLTKHTRLCGKTTNVTNML